jgi:two-component system sensor histidine kinase AlgZ
MNPAESFLPNFCSLPATFVLVIASLLLAFVLTLADFSPEFGFWADLGLRALFILWITLASGTVLCLLRRRLSRRGGRGEGLTAFAVVQAMTLLMAAFAREGLPVLTSGSPATADPVTYYLRILAVSSLVAAAWLRYLYVQSCLSFQTRAESLARLDALQARMRPHFLFNSLNTIASLTRQEPARAEELLLDLAEVFRAVLRKDSKLVCLADEIELSRQYLNIEQQRLGRRLQVVWDVDRAAHDALLPPLSLQPLIENAVLHGIEPAQQGGRLEIHGRLNRKGLILTVRNSLPEARARRSRPGTQEALANLRARLETCFPDRARLLTSVVDHHYLVRILVPYLPKPYENPDR